MAVAKSKKRCSGHRYRLAISGSVAAHPLTAMATNGRIFMTLFGPGAETLAKHSRVGS